MIMRNYRNPGSGRRPGRRTGFTLVEMLAVIAIIGILAALALTILPASSDAAKRKRAKSQLTQIETAIAAYHAQHGFYPPDNPNDSGIHQLYHELTGVKWNQNQGTFTDAMDNPVNVSLFGVGGIVNAVKSGEPKNLFGAAKLDVVDIGGAKLLKVPMDLPEGYTNAPIAAKPTVNVWRYKSSGPDLHNQQSYDLWAELVIKGKVVRISNWER